jgi:hypothetical protein
MLVEERDGEDQRGVGQGNFLVMAGLDPAIHAFGAMPCLLKKGVDRPVKPGDDEVDEPVPMFAQ